MADGVATALLCLYLQQLFRLKQIHYQFSYELANHLKHKKKKKNWQQKFTKDPAANFSFFTEDKSELSISPLHLLSNDKKNNLNKKCDII